MLLKLSSTEIIVLYGVWDNAVRLIHEEPMFPIIKKLVS